MPVDWDALRHANGTAIKIFTLFFSKKRQQISLMSFFTPLVGRMGFGAFKKVVSENWISVNNVSSTSKGAISNRNTNEKRQAKIALIEENRGKVNAFRAT